MPLDARSEHSGNTSPKIAEPHINLNSLHNAYDDVPDLVPPKENSCFLGVFDIKFEVSDLKMTFD